MRAKPTDRSAPGVGSASVKFFDEKHHKQILRDVKSRVGSQFNDASTAKRRMDLAHFKRDQGLEKLRQIDKKNLKLFIRLAHVQPSVPVVVKRTIVEYNQLDSSLASERKVDGTLETEGLNGSQLRSDTMGKRSISMPRTR